MDKLFLKGFEYVKIKKYKQAEQYLKRCIAKNKNHFDALHLLAIIYTQSGKSRLAINYFERAYSIKNNVIELNQNYVESLLNISEIKSCLSLVDVMLTIFPDDIKLLTIKAKALLNHNDYLNSLDIYDSLFRISKNIVFLLGQAKCEAGMNNWEIATTKVKIAIDMSPFNSEVCDYYVECLFNSKRYFELVEFSLKNHKNFTQINRKRVFYFADQALNFLSEDDKVNKFIALHNILPIVSDEMIDLHIASKCPPVFSSNEDINEYRERYISAIEKISKKKISFPCKQFRPLSHFYLSYNGINNRHINQKLSNLYPVQNDTKLSTSTHMKKKVLVISDRLYDHHTISKLNLGLLVCLSKGAFDITIWVPTYDCHVSVNDLKKLIKKVNLVSSDIELLTNDIKTLKPDLIFYPEIGMSNLIYCLANERLAPIQFTSWGHPETTGIKNIDYFVSSQHIEPPNGEGHYTEKLINLTQLPSVYSRVKCEKLLTTHMQCFEQNNRYISCLQSAFKFHPEFDGIIKTILEQNPEIKLYIITSDSCDLLINRFKKSGIKEERIVTLPKMENSDFLNIYSKSIVALDPIHFGGGNTVYEAMSLAVPIVTLPGEFMRGRVTQGAYKQMGFETLIAKSKDNYVELVSRLIQDDCFNKKIRQEIVDKSHALFETKEVAKELEDKLIGLIDNVK